MTRRLSPAIRFLSAATALFSLTLFSGAEEPARITAFAPDAGHLWNRVYASLPPAGSQGLVAAPKEEAKQAATALLTEFVKEGAPAPETMTPLQRAQMQRHLLTYFFAVPGLAHRQPVEGKKETEFPAALTRAIRKIALTAEEIRKLPDNYAAVMALPDAVTTYDLLKPAPFLPKDLLSDDGPWLGLALTPQGGRQGVIAPLHFEIYQGTISFEVRMRHPEGRAAGEAYLKSLAEMKEPFLKEATPESKALSPLGPQGGRYPNPQTPQFPPGTAWALVHRAILADKEGRPVVSPLVEAVQIRVYRTVSLENIQETPAFKAELAALEAQKKAVDRSLLALEHYQTTFEWTMRGAQSLANRGFHLSATHDTLFGMETKDDVPVRVVCAMCHSAVGIHSVNTRAGLFDGRIMERAPEFQAAPRVKLDEVTLEAAAKKAVWRRLQEAWGK